MSEKSERTSPCTVCVELLESRTLLSTGWAGTWNVSGLDITARSLPANGKIAVTGPALTVSLTQTTADEYSAVLTTWAATRMRTETRVLQLGDDGLSGDFTGQDVDASGNVTYWRLYIRMMQVDADVRMFDMTSVGYTDTNGTQRIQWVNVYAGVASQQRLQVVSFPYAGNYSFNGFQMVATTQDDQVQVTPDFAESPNTLIERTGSRTYTVDAINSGAERFLDGAGRLSQVVAGPTHDGTYARYMQMYYRGPHGRLYYRGGGMEANTNAQRTDALGAVPLGQILSGWTQAGYSDADAHNFAPILPRGASVALNPISEDEGDNAGTAVAEILGSGLATDWNSNARAGIAITGASRRRGSWEYSTDGGASWQAMDAVSTTHSLLLTDAASNRIRFVPQLNYNGTLSPALAFRAWDQTIGGNATYASTWSSGRLTAFSSSRAIASIVVTPINDAPVLAGTLATPTYLPGRLPIGIGGGLIIRDTDSRLLSGATVTISSGYADAEDVLSYSGTITGITGTVSGNTVQLTGTASIAAYLAAIHAVRYQHSAGGTSFADRILSIQVQDDQVAASNVVTQALHVAPPMAPLITSVFSTTPLAGGDAVLLA